MEKIEELKDIGDIREVKEYLQRNNIDFKSNDNISQYLSNNSMTLMEYDLEEKFKEILDIMLIDHENDPNTNDTPRRLAKMFIHEVFYGRFYNMPKVTSFPNQSYDELYITGPITIQSMCSHHFQNISGNCWAGVFPGENVIGLSKFNRIVDWVCRRPQIQEEMTEQIADKVQELTNANGVAVVVKATHNCITHRGVREHDNEMTTSVMRGRFREDPSFKNEFLWLIDTRRT